MFIFTDKRYSTKILLLIFLCGCISGLSAAVYTKALQPATRNIEYVICSGESYDFYGESKTESGIYTHLVENTECDTLVTLNLTVYPSYKSSSRIGKFSINASGEQVTFSPGNLQYNAAKGTHLCADGTIQPGTWRFAEHQWDYVGDASDGTVYENGVKSNNADISSSYNGWIDLFGWGTSGWESGALAVQPYSTANSSSSYHPGSSNTNNLTGAYAYADWAVYNAIGDDAPNTWRTLTQDEWRYIFEERPDFANLRGHAKIDNYVAGYVLLPDDWVLPAGLTFTPGTNNGYMSNEYTLSQWEQMENAGAVFLPAAGRRTTTTISGSLYGYYWSSTAVSSSSAGQLYFYSSNATISSRSRYSGISVRPVRPYNLASGAIVVYDSVCRGSTYYWEGDNYTEEGQYTKTLTTIHGCDSVVILYLSYYPVYNVSFTQYIDKGASYTWEGDNYTEEGQYTKTFTTIHGCDSVVTMDLRYYPSLETAEYISYCVKYARRNVVLSPPEGQFVDYQWQQLVNGEWQVLSSNSLTQTITLPASLSDTLYLCFQGREMYDNLIVNGNFESGNTGFQTGYTYSSTTINPEGNYSITNDVHNVHNNARCNSDHTTGSGYMMAINGGSDANANVWTQTVTNLQPNTDYAFSAWAANWTDYGYNYAELEFSINGVLQGQRFSPNRGTCNWTQIYTVWNSGNTTTAQIRLVNRQTGQVANDFCVDDIYFSPLSDERSSKVYYKVFLEASSTTVLNDTICEGQTYRWGGHTYTAAGDYSQTYTDVSGCDSVVTMHLVVIPKAASHEYITIIEGETYDWNGGTYSTTGDYSTTGLQAVNGCDSTAWLHLTVSDKPVITRPISVSFCNGDSYDFYGETVAPTADAVYTHTLTGQTEDTLVTLNVTVWPTYTDVSFDANICEGETYAWEGGSYSTAGDYTKTLTTVHGCDSIVTMHLIINHPVVTHEYMSLFTGETYDWNGGTYSTTGDYASTGLQTIYGCDSTAWLHLTVSDKPVITRSETASICSGDSYDFYGETIAPTVDAVYTRTLTGKMADTLVTLDVTVLPTYTDVSFDVTICGGETYTWEGSSYSTTGDYTKTLTNIFGCDSVVTLHLVVNPSYSIEIVDTISKGCAYGFHDDIYYGAGDYVYPYTTSLGCDSIVTLHLIENQITVYEAIVNEQCAGEGLLDIYLRMDGKINQAVIHFDGEQDTTVTVQNAHIAVPYNAKAGRYTYTLDLMYCGQVVDTIVVPFTLLYPSSVLEQAWNDVVAVLTHDYNGGYDFVAFQWYENGVPIVGETHSYLHRNLSMGAEYSALLTDVNGLELMTCPIVATPQVDMTLYPTVLSGQKMIHCLVSEQTIYTLYDFTGRVCESHVLDIGEHIMNGPDRSGIYMVQLQCVHSENERTFKLIVK